MNMEAMPTGPRNLVVTNASLATCENLQASARARPGCAFVVVDGSIVWLGPDRELPAQYGALTHLDVGGAMVTPGLIDCHTHLVFAGDRSAELERRLAGEDYTSIAAGGGGILGTVAATRAASEERLLELALRRARVLLAEGVTTLEVKSGYGLACEVELRSLRVARRVGEILGLDVHTTLLAAHALPPEFAGKPDQYIDHVIQRILPSALEAGLVDSVDAFCETIAFSGAQIRRLFDAARAAGLPVRLHADQLSNGGGARLAADYRALSADHLEYTEASDIQALAQAGCVAVLLPGAYYYLRESRKPDVDSLRAHGVALAVATDFNPGSSPLLSLRLAMNLACLLFGLTPAEALLGVTRNAALALGLPSLGQLVPGARGDFVIWSGCSEPSALAAGVGEAMPDAVYKAGRRIA